jgi:hypothetical protein
MKLSHTIRLIQFTQDLQQSRFTRSVLSYNSICLTTLLRHNNKLARLINKHKWSVTQSYTSTLKICRAGKRGAISNANGKPKRYENRSRLTVKLENSIPIHSSTERFCPFKMVLAFYCKGGHTFGASSISLTLFFKKAW